MSEVSERPETSMGSSFINLGIRRTKQSIMRLYRLSGTVYEKYTPRTNFLILFREFQMWYLGRVPMSKSRGSSY